MNGLFECGVICAIAEGKHVVDRLVAVTSHSYNVPNERDRLTKLFHQADIQTHLHSANRELPAAPARSANYFIIIKLMEC